MIWVILIIMLVIFIAGAFYSGFLMTVYPIYDFFFHTRWGFLAIIFLSFSYIFGFLSKKTREDVKLKDVIMDSVKLSFIELSKLFKINNIEMKNKNVSLKQQDAIVDMTKISIDGVLKNFAMEINKPAPQIFLGWGNRRLVLRNQRVKIFNDYLLSIKELGENYLKLQASAIFSYEKVSMLIDIERKELDAKSSSIDEAKKRDILETTRKELENQMLQAKIDDMKAVTKTKLMEASSKQDREFARTALLIEASKYIDKLSPFLITYLSTQLATDNPVRPDNEFDIQEDLKDAIKRIKLAEAKKAEAEANEAKAQSRFNINELRNNK